MQNFVRVVLMINDGYLVQRVSYSISCQDILRIAEIYLPMCLMHFVSTHSFPD